MASDSPPCGLLPSAFHLLYFVLAVALVALPIPCAALLARTAAQQQETQAIAAQEQAPTASSLLKQGNDLLAQGKWNEAAEAYHNALALRPAYAEAHYGLANVYTAEQKIPDAL